jgi:hypothetical protein
LEREVALLREQVDVQRQLPLDVPVPERFTVEKGAGTTTISWRWGSWAHAIVVVVLGFWMLGIAKAFRHGDLEGAAWQALFAVPLIYWALACFLNNTRIEASAHQLRVRRGPLPAGGNALLAREQLRQLFVSETNKVDDENKTVTTSYALHAVLVDGREKLLVKDIERLHEATYLEYTLERMLGIANARVPGEAKR